MKLTCETCKRTIPGEDIDLSRAVGVCRICGELISFASMPLVVAAPTGIYRPEDLSFDEERTRDGYIGTIKPRPMRSLGSLIFALAWNVFVIFWIAIAARGVWPMALFGLLFLGVGLRMAYAVLVDTVNTVRLVTRKGRILFFSGPIPTRGNLDADVGTVDGFVVTSHTTSGKSKTTTYPVVVNFANGTARKLRFSPSDREEAEFVAERLNAALVDAKKLPADVPFRS